MASLGVGRPGGRTAHPRQPSTPLYTLFSPSQIKQFQEAFNLLDADRDGFLTASDLSSAVANVGLPLTASDLLASAGPSGAQGKVSFTAFLTMMGDHLLQFDKGQVLQEAFASFDPTDEGVVSVAELREVLAGSGDRMSNDEVDALLSSRFVDERKGTFDYREFVKSLKVNEPEPDEDGTA